MTCSDLCISEAWLCCLRPRAERGRVFLGGSNEDQKLTIHFNSWDDWVPQDRLRKFTDDNRELAATLRRDAEAAFRQRTGQKPLPRKRGGSDSGRGSEERQSSVPARGNKRGRDNEIEKVRVN